MNVNIWSIYFELRMKDEIEERSLQLGRNLSSCEKKSWKNSSLNGIWTHDVCDAGVVLYQLSYPGNGCICHLLETTKQYFMSRQVKGFPFGRGLSVRMKPYYLLIANNSKKLHFRTWYNGCCLRVIKMGQVRQYGLSIKLRNISDILQFSEL